MQFHLYYALRQTLHDKLALSAAQPPSDGSLLAPGFSRRVGLVLHSSSARFSAASRPALAARETEEERGEWR